MTPPSARFERGVIEVRRWLRAAAPLRRVRDLDEAQTHRASSSRCFSRDWVRAEDVVSGDVTQIDLPRERRATVDAEHLFAGTLTTSRGLTIGVRHPLIAKLVAAYQRAGDA